ncbi:MAG: putative toxin-antitoxin system toxin component, PIN family [Betaproteobacteria bacterium]
MHLVLDTNVWIDWLVFDDPSVAPLKAAQRDGLIDITVNEVCIEELNLVLGYPEFRLDDAQKKQHLADVSRCSNGHTARQRDTTVVLPRCSDPDDQKFLLLAYQAAAEWLLTRDKALLRLSRRARTAGFCIGSPAQWSAQFARST